MQLAFRKYGSGQPLLILHGLFGQSDNWNTLAKRFGDNGFEVYTIDLRNHGLSPHSEEWNYEVMADDINEFISDHSLQNPILLGHSMGGKVAMFFAMKYPNVLDKLIVADMSPRQYEPHHAAVLDALNAVNFSEINNRRDAEAILSKYIDDFGTKQFLLKNIYWEDSANNKMNWRFNLPVITKKYDIILEAVPERSVRTKTLFIRGEKSNYIREIDVTEIKKRFTDYILETIPGAGHWVHAEKPNEFYDLVFNFISTK
ncbi:MAG: alpha/beta fold hydrolase [Bacteroidia bacterium]